jgi:hypothetical protein
MRIPFHVCKVRPKSLPNNGVKAPHTIAGHFFPRNQTDAGSGRRDVRRQEAAAEVGCSLLRPDHVLLQITQKIEIKSSKAGTNPAISGFLRAS